MFEHDYWRGGGGREVGAGSGSVMKGVRCNELESGRVERREF